MLRRVPAGVRQDGYVIAPAFIEDVATGIAVPMRDGRGEVIAAPSAAVA